jgi:copper(I)-binding protein
MNVRSFLLGLALLACSSAAVAVTPACVPVIENAWIRAAPPTAMMLAGYATVRNPCKAAFVITDVSSPDFAMAMMHETTVEKGISKMRDLDSLALPPAGEVRFAPNGRHLMLMNPKRQFKAGDALKLNLSLADGRRISADFIVRAEPPK